MKTRILGALLIMPSLLWAQGGAYTINGTLTGVAAPAKAYLAYGSGPQAKMDSVSIRQGQFSFKGTIEEATPATLFVDKSGAGFSRRRPIPATGLYLEPGTITVVSPDSLDNAVVGGTPLNRDAQTLKLALKPASDNMALLMKEYRTATPEQQKSRAFGEALEKRYNGIEAGQKAIMGEFVRTNPQSMISLDALRAYGGGVPDYAVVSPLFEGLSDAVKTSRSGKAYAASLATMKLTAVGATAPEFTQADTSGKAVALHDFRGKYVLVDFWASWCGPCRAENPNVVKNYTQFKDKNFTVLGVSLDRPNARDAWLKAIHKDGLDWTQVSDLKFWDNEVAKQYGVRSIPQNFLIGPDGKIVAKNIRGDELGKKLAEVLVAKP